MSIRALQVEYLHSRAFCYATVTHFSGMLSQLLIKR